MNVANCIPDVSIALIHYLLRIFPWLVLMRTLFRIHTV
jgi:hypothetical protein